MEREGRSFLQSTCDVAIPFICVVLRAVLHAVISMREPISQAISMRLHNLGHNRM